MKNMLHLCMFSKNLTQLAKLENVIRLGSLEHIDYCTPTIHMASGDIYVLTTVLQKNPLSKNLFCYTNIQSILWLSKSSKCAQVALKIIQHKYV